MDVQNWTAVAALVLSVIALITGGFSAYDTRRSRRIAEDALATSRTSTAMAAKSARLADEARHDATTPDIRPNLGGYRDRFCWIKIDVIRVPAPITMRVTIDGSSFYSDGNGYGIQEQEELTGVVSSTAPELKVPYKENNADDPYLNSIGTIIGMVMNVQIESIKTSAEWDEVAAWELYTQVGWGSNLSEE